MSIEEFISQEFTKRGLKTSSSATAILSGSFSTYELIDLDINFGGTPTAKTSAESATLSFNCYGKTKGEAYSEARAVCRTLEEIQFVRGVNSTNPYGIHVLPIMNNLHGYTLMASIVYFEKELVKDK